MKLLPSIFKQRAGMTEPWQWPLCRNPRTLSFRVGDDVFKTVNSVFFDQTVAENAAETESPESWFTSSSDTASLSTEKSDRDLDAESIETVVREVARSDRLFFEPIETNSILKEAKVISSDLDSVSKSGADNLGIPFKESVVVAVDTADPYRDFRRSMEEMVTFHALSKDWECLEAMLGWYLRMNKKDDHGVIVGAFVDCLVSIASGGGGGGGGGGDEYESGQASGSDYATCYSSAVSSFRSSPWCPSQRQTEIEEEQEEDDDDL